MEFLNELLWCYLLTLFESEPNNLSFLPSSGSTFDIMSPRAKLADGPSRSLGGTSSVKI